MAWRLNEHEMTPPHKFYLNLGSNIFPERHLAQAMKLLRRHGALLESSSVWESEAVGSSGPHFLNLSVGFQTKMNEAELKATVVDSIETALGRSRTTDKNAPRTIDIDIILMDDRPVNPERWAHPFVVLPMAELLPELVHPVTGRRLVDEAPVSAASLWIRRRPDVLLSRD